MKCVILAGGMGIDQHPPETAPSPRWDHSSPGHSPLSTSPPHNRTMLAGLFIIEMIVSIRQSRSATTRRFVLHWLPRMSPHSLRNVQLRICRR